VVVGERVDAHQALAPQLLLLLLLLGELGVLPRDQRLGLLLLVRERRLAELLPAQRLAVVRSKARISA